MSGRGLRRTGYDCLPGCTDLLLQPYDAGPFLLQQPLILLGRFGVEGALIEPELGPERSSGVGQVLRGEVGDDGLVPAVVSKSAAGRTRIRKLEAPYSSSACRVVRI